MASLTPSAALPTLTATSATEAKPPHQWRCCTADCEYRLSVLGRPQTMADSAGPGYRVL